MALRLALAVWAATAALPAAAATLPACPHATPMVRLRVVDPAPVVSTALGTAALEAETGQPHRPETHHLGLTTSRVEWHSEIETRYRETAGGVCARPMSVLLTLVQTEHMLRIAAEIPPGGCLWQEVERHERRHVAVNRRTLQAAGAGAEAAARAWAARTASRGRTLDEAMAALQAGLRRAIEPALAGMRAARGALHLAIDSRAEYRRLSEACPADQRRLRDRLRAPASGGGRHGMTLASLGGPGQAAPP